MIDPLHARIYRRADLAMERGRYGEAAILDWLGDEAESIRDVPPHT
jgi:hypothetical protein